jgi:hypothetical protein
MNYSVVHTACGKELFTLQMPTRLRSSDDIASLAMQQLEVAEKKSTEHVEGGWPLECENCGQDLTFFQGRDGYRPVLRLSGTTIFHN